MPCSSSRRTLLLLLGLAACARNNPVFGLDGTGEDGGSTSASASTTDGIETTISSQSSTATTTSDPGDGTSNVDGDSSGSTGTHDCGNGSKESPEECDDGDNNGEEQLCLPDCTRNVCGDEHLAPDQPCDDGNSEPGDGCDMCKLTSCGNGVIEGAEECDEGPAGSTTCTRLCTVPFCGDMIMSAPEECDDGNSVDEDDCISCNAAACGDGFEWTGVEECDDHNLEDNDGCSALCAMEFCGDGIVQLNEECDGDPPVPPECTDLDMNLYDLSCDMEQCRWFVEGDVDCCMAAGDPCTNQIPCCPGTNCIDEMGICGAG